MTFSDEELRDLLAATDPLPAQERQAPDSLLERLLEESRLDPAPAGPSDDRTWLRRHWQGSLLVAASLATLVLAAPLAWTALFGLSGGSDSSVAGSVAVAPAAPEAGDAVEKADAAIGAEEATELTAEQAPRLVRNGSVLVGTDDITGGRDTFVAYVASVGGRVMSESAVTQGSAGGGAEPAVVSDIAGSYPYPWYPSGPGIWLTVEVPEERFEETMRAAAGTGEVVRSEQSSYDVGAQMADVDARIAALEASLQRLTALLGQAASVSDVVALESAIAQRQSELDGLKAQQRDLANQTTMSRVSLTLMSPADARDAVDPQPTRTWWEAFLDGLSDLWSWLGKALLITSPLLLAAAVIWWVRRRRRGGSSSP